MDKLDLLDTSDCCNCTLLVNYCKTLQTQVKSLSDKVDSLIKLISCTKLDNSIQYNIGTHGKSTSCTTEDLISVNDNSCQTECYSLDTNENPAQTNSDHANQTDTLFDIFLQAPGPNTV